MHAAHDDDDEQEDDEQTDAQAEFLADHREDKIGVSVRQIHHFLASISEAKPFHPAATPRDQRLHLLQAGVVLEAFRVHKRRQPCHAFGNECCNPDQPYETARANTAEQQQIRPGYKHDHEHRAANQRSRSKIDFSNDQAKETTDDCERYGKASKQAAAFFFPAREPVREKENSGNFREFGGLKGE